MFNFFSNTNNTDITDNSLMTLRYKIPLIEDPNSSDSIIDIANKDTNINYKSLFKLSNVPKSIYKSIYKKNKNDYKEFKSIKKYIKPKYKKYNYMEYAFYKN